MRRAVRYLPAIVAVAMLAVLPLFLGGCASSPEARYEQASIVYTRTLQGIKVAQIAGKVSDDTLAEIEPYRAAVRAALDECRRIIESGQPLTDADVRVFDAALNAWLDAMIARGVESKSTADTAVAREKAEMGGGTPPPPTETGDTDGG